MDELKRLGFFAVGTYEEGKAFRGALLITDTETKPVEFRCTSPVRPTMLQKILYGASLERYLKVTCLAEPLLRRCTEKPDVLLVNDRTLLELRSKAEVPVLLLTRQGDASFGGDVEEGKPPMITSEGGSFEAIVVVAPADHADEGRAMREELQEVFRKNDLLEPFERALRGLEQVHAEKVGDK